MPGQHPAASLQGVEARRSRPRGVMGGRPACRRGAGPRSGWPGWKSLTVSCDPGRPPFDRVPHYQSLTARHERSPVCRSCPHPRLVAARATAPDGGAWRRVLRIARSAQGLVCARSRHLHAAETDANEGWHRADIALAPGLPGLARDVTINPPAAWARSPRILNTGSLELVRLRPLSRQGSCGSRLARLRAFGPVSLKHAALCERSAP
jgi:hypothetical protein